MLNECLIIAYSTPNYILTNHFLKSLNNININSSNIEHFIDDKLPLQNENCALSNFWYSCKQNKLKHCIDVVKNNKHNSNYKYFISSDCDIWFIKENVKKWDNLQKYIDTTDQDIYFMRENDTTDVNCGFFIIKNNDNLINVINFLDKIFNIMIVTKPKDMLLGEQTLINKYKSDEINFGYIPNDYVVWGSRVFDKNKSLFHHPVCCFNQQEKIQQIRSIKSIFKNSYNVIVARYKENLDWVEQLDKSNVVIYNKSDEPLENAITRPNIGRDPETFLYHRIQNYDNLPEYLIFLQGDPFSHFSDVTVDKYNLQSKIDELVNSNIDASPFCCNLHYQPRNIEDLDSGLNTVQYFSFLFDEPIPNKLCFACGCQYIISKKNILVRPKQFYEYIYNMISITPIITLENALYDSNIFDINHMSVWTLERLIFYIFNDKIKLSNLIKQIINYKKEEINSLI